MVPPRRGGSSGPKEGGTQMPSGAPCSVTAARPHRTDPVGLRGRTVHAGVKSTERAAGWAPVFHGVERPFGKVEGSGNGRRGRPRNCVNVLDTSELHAWWLRRYVSGQGYLTRYTDRFQEGRLLPCEGPGGRALGWRPAPCGGSVSTDHRLPGDSRCPEVRGRAGGVPTAGEARAFLIGQARRQTVRGLCPGSCE